MLNYEFLDALGVKWVCCLGEHGANARVFLPSALLPLQHTPAL